MNADVLPMKTGAELALAETFAASKATLPGDKHVAALRAAAFKSFDRQGLPTWRAEQWHYTDLRAILRDAKPLAEAPDAAAKTRAKTAGGLVGDIEARRIVFVDGAFVPALSDLTNLSPGLTIRSMAAALKSGDPLLTRLGQVMAVDDSAVALNTALMRDGALIHVRAGSTVERPIHLVFATTGDKPAAVFTRSLAVIEQGARAMLIESHDGVTAAEYQVNTALEMTVGDKAHVDHIKIVSGGAGTIHVGSLIAAIGANARFNNFNFTAGGTVVRNQLFLRFDGEGTLAGIRGASLLKGKQHADITLTADHKAGGCQSREVFKAVLDDQARSVFQGKIIVRPHAQKTDAKMMTQALLLSDECEADAKPELEIFADDVQCGHGATSGALDEDLRFYLMARGIPEKEAEALLVQAFVGEAIEGIEHAGLREALMDHVIAWLKERAR